MIDDVNLNQSLYHELLDALRIFISDEFRYKSNIPQIVSTPPPKKPEYPHIIFTEIDNRLKRKMMGGNQTETVLGFEFDCWSVDKPPVSRIELVDECVRVINILMSHNGAKRVSGSPTPVTANTLYRRTVRYNVQLYNNTNMIF